MSKKLLILMILIFVGFIGLIGAFLFIGASDQPSDHSMLVLLVDPQEHQPGLGAVDFAFVVQLENYSITDLTPIYPTGPPLGFHPTTAPPIEMTNVHVYKLYLHDALYDAPLNTGAKHAQEIVEYNKGIKTDSVIIIKPQAVDAILESIGGVDINGSHVTNNSLSFLRDEQNNGNISRPDIVESMGFAIKEESKNSSKRAAMIQAITIQYAEGNIVVIPNDLFLKLINPASLKKLIG